MAWKNIGAVLSGVLVMVLVDLLLARVAPTPFALAISISVFIGAAIKGLIVRKKWWFWGLLVGVINVCITIALFFWISPQVSIFDVVARPILLSLVFGIVGGTIGGWLKSRSIKNRPSTAV
jgi:putative membrane protein (TIGR04086 family)